MPFTDKYDLEEISYGVSGWNGILTTDLQILDDVIHTRYESTVGEAVAAYTTVEIRSDGKVYNSLTTLSGTDYVPIGIMIEAGVLDETKRAQISGLIVNNSWSWTPGDRLYTHRTVSGTLTDTLTVTGTNTQHYIGVAVTSSGILLQIQGA